MKLTYMEDLISAARHARIMIDHFIHGEEGIDALESAYNRLSTALAASYPPKEGIEHLAKKIAFAGRSEHDVSESPDDFWEHTNEDNRVRYRAMALAATLDIAGQVSYKPTHRHKKRSEEVVLLSYGRMQAEGWFQPLGPEPGPMSVDMREIAIYRSVNDGSWWVRPREEFEDGRFEVLGGNSDG